MKRVMIVDSSSVIRKVAKRILSSPEIVVAEAETGQDALDSCQIAMPASIILDHHLAGMSDLDFIAKVKELCEQSEQDMPRIYVNLFEKDVIAIMRAKRAGASGFLLKPFNRTSLINTFRELDKAA